MNAIFTTLLLLCLAASFLGVCYSWRERTRAKVLAIGIALVTGLLAAAAYLSTERHGPDASFVARF